MSECQIRLREQGLPYPRTCQKCKFSGCAEGLNKPAAQASRIAALEAALKRLGDKCNWTDMRDAGADPYDGTTFPAWVGADDPAEIARAALEAKE